MERGQRPPSRRHRNLRHRPELRAGRWGRRLEPDEDDSDEDVRDSGTASGELSSDAESVAISRRKRSARLALNSSEYRSRSELNVDSASSSGRPSAGIYGFFRSGVRRISGFIRRLMVGSYNYDNDDYGDVDDDGNSGEFSPRRVR